MKEIECFPWSLYKHDVNMCYLILLFHAFIIIIIYTYMYMYVLSNIVYVTCTSIDPFFHIVHVHSDIDIVLADRKMPGHRFVLAARSRRWNQDETLTSTSELDLSHMTPFVAGSMIRWVYTDSIILPSEQTAMIELLSAANKYHLPELKEK